MTSYQNNADFIFDRIKEYAILETLTWTIDANGMITDSTSSNTAINCVVQDLVAEDFTRISAGHIPKSDKRIYVPRTVTLKSGKYDVSGATTQQFIHYPTDGTSTIPSGAEAYEITQVSMEGRPADFGPDIRANATKVYTMAYLIKVQASG